MARDILVLGGIAFDDFSTPAHMPFGGEQAMIVHKLPGGSRVIDRLGPDDMDLTWRGRLWGLLAYETALQLDALRRGGNILGLSFAGQAYTVIISSFEAELERFPQDILYTITCVVVSPRASSGYSPLGASMLASADLAAAVAINGGALATSAEPDQALTFVNVPVTTRQIPDLVRQLPTRLPAQPGRIWNNGGVISVS